MESFKFIINPIVNANSPYLKIDIITILQYYSMLAKLYINKIAQANNYNITINDFYIKPGNKLSDSKTFIAQLDKYFNLNIVLQESDYYFSPIMQRYVLKPCANKGCHTWGDLILNFFNLINLDDFDKFINYYVNDDYINDYNYVHTHVETDNPTEYHNNNNHWLNSSNHTIMYVLNDIVVCRDTFDLNDNISKDLFTPVIKHDTFVPKLVNEYTKQIIDTCGSINNTMSENIVYTDDPEIIKQVLKNNQKIIKKLFDNIENKNFEKPGNKQVLKELLSN